MSFSSKTVADHIHPDDRLRVLSNMKSRFEGKSIPDSNQYRCIHKAGHVVWLEVSTRLISYQGQPALLSYAIDLTRQRKNLIDSEELYRRIMENPIEGICLAQDGNYIFMNDTFSRIFGYTKKELMGKPIVTIVDPKEHKIISDRVRKRYQHKKVVPLSLIHI